MIGSSHQNIGTGMRVFNKVMRGTRAEFALLLREEDFLHLDGTSSGSSDNDSGSDGNSNMDLDARVRNIVSWASEALKLLRRDEHLAMVTPQNAEYSSSTQGNDAVLIKPPSSSAKPNLAFFERRRREASSQQQQETQNFASEDGNEKEEEEEESTLSPAKHLLLRDAYFSSPECFTPSWWIRRVGHVLRRSSFR